MNGGPDGSNRILIRSGTLIDGSGAPRRQADILIVGDRISAIVPPGSLPADGAEAIDAGGLVIAPGFIDVHTHDDNAVLVGPEMTAKISQGVTTVIAGNCGISIAPGRLVDPPAPLTLIANSNPNTFRFDRLRDYVDAVTAAAPSVNIALLIGHSTLRVGAMSEIDRKATAAEIDVMRERLAECLDDGAIGFSTGLYYKVAAPADIEEVVALAELLSDKGVYVTHMRDEHDGVIDSLHESFETANRAHVPIVISHHKCAGPRNWGRSRDTLKVIEAARRNQRVSLDVYPYVAGSTVLEPEWVDPEIRIMVSWSIPHPEMAGRDLAEIAGAWRVSQTDAARRLKPAGAIYFQIDEADMRRILSYPPTMIGSDGLPHDNHPHPRLWGTFPRVLGRYCRQEGLFTLEEAIHKMTGLPAETFHLRDRGVVREGAFADLVLFDADEIIDCATFEDPKQPAEGIAHVIVNGRIGWRDGRHLGAGSGRFVTRN